MFTIIFLGNNVTITQQAPTNPDTTLPSTIDSQSGDCKRPFLSLSIGFEFQFALNVHGLSKGIGCHKNHSP